MIGRRVAGSARRSAHRRRRLRSHDGGRFHFNWRRRRGRGEKLGAGGVDAWKLPDRGGYIRSRRQFRNQCLDLAPAAPAGPGEHRLMVLRREVRVEHPDRREGQRTRGEGVQDHWKTPTGPRGVDPVAGGILGEPEDVRAVGEERTVAMGSVEGGSRLELRQVGDELDGHFPLFARKGHDAGEEILIGETRRDERGGSYSCRVLYHGDFWRHRRRPCRRKER